LTKNYARPELDQIRLGEVIKRFSDLAFQDEHHGEDVLGRVDEYFLGQFAIAEGKRGGQFYTAGSVVRVLVEMLQPFEGRVYDPCCGSGGMFVQSERFVEAHNGRRDDGKRSRARSGAWADPSHFPVLREKTPLSRRKASSQRRKHTCDQWLGHDFAELAGSGIWDAAGELAAEFGTRSTACLFSMKISCYN
jgi:hypothetical protein